MGLLLDQTIKMCLIEFSAVLVAITHADGTVAVHLLNGSPLQTILNIIDVGVAGSCIISFLLIKKFNQMDFLIASNSLNDSYVAFLTCCLNKSVFYCVRAVKEHSCFHCYVHC